MHFVCYNKNNEINKISSYFLNLQIICKHYAIICPNFVPYCIIYTS